MTQTFDKRWLALIILCLGDPMIVLDMTVVTVALPSIRTDLNCSETSLVWVINAYIADGQRLSTPPRDTGGSLRQSEDVCSRKRAICVCLALMRHSGFAVDAGGARALQGLGGAIFSAVALAIVINL